MKAKYGAAIGAAMIVAAIIVVLGNGFGAAQNANQRKDPKYPVRYEYKDMVDGDGRNLGDRNPVKGLRTAGGEQDDKPVEKKVALTVEAQNHDTREPLAGARIRILEISHTAPGRNDYAKGDSRKVLRVLATGVTGSDGRFTTKVPATAVLSVEAAPPTGPWAIIETPALITGWGCQDACVEVPVQDGKFMWRSNGNAGTYRPVNDSEREHFEPLVFTFRCI